MTTKFRRVGEIEMDSRRRASFGKFGHHSRYAVEVNDNGELLLIPLLPSLTQQEFEAQMQRVIEQARNGETIDYRTSFAQYVDDENG